MPRCVTIEILYGWLLRDEEDTVAQTLGIADAYATSCKKKGRGESPQVYKKTHIQRSTDISTNPVIVKGGYCKHTLRVSSADTARASF